MKSTSAPYLLHLYLSAALVPLACSGSTEKAAEPGDAVESAGGQPEAASGGSGATEPTHAGGSGEVSLGGSPDAGAIAGAGAAAAAGGTAGKAGVGASGASGAPDAEVGGQGAAGEAAAAGAGGEGGSTIQTPIDPSLDGASDTASGRYRLHYRDSSDCLTASVGKVGASACSNAKEQEIFLDGAGGDFVRVRGVVSNACVTRVGSAIAEVVCSEDSKLQFVILGLGYFQLKPTSDSCLALKGGQPFLAPCTASTAWYLDSRSTNFAAKASWSATSTFPGYSLDYVHDGDFDTGLSGHSWANNWNPPSLVLPQEVMVDLGAPRQFSRINILTSQGYEIGSYDIDYYTGGAWKNLVVVQGNQQLSIAHVFPTIVTQKLRFVMRRGPEAQFIYTRLNEVEIY